MYHVDSHMSNNNSFYFGHFMSALSLSSDYIPSGFYGGPLLPVVLFKDPAFMGVLLGVLPKEGSMLQVISINPVGILKCPVQNRFTLHHKL